MMLDMHRLVGADDEKNHVTSANNNWNGERKEALFFLNRGRDRGELPRNSRRPGAVWSYGHFYTVSTTASRLGRYTTCPMIPSMTRYHSGRSIWTRRMLTLKQ